MLFRAASGLAEGELWAYEPSTAECRRLTSPDCDVTGYGGGLAALSTVAVFVAETTAAGRELWVTDGTPEGTGLLADINPGSVNSYPSEMVRFGDHLYFQADDGVNGTELWVTDGTPEGTSLVCDIAPGSADSDPYPIVPASYLLFFTAEIRDVGRELWASDGSASGTYRLADILPGPCSSSPYAIAAAPTGVFFSARQAETGEELWFSDGTPEGTRLVKDIRPGPESSEPYETVVMDGVAYFEADDGRHGSELWRSDGTAEGTWLVADINQPERIPVDLDPRLLTAWKDTLVFVGRGEGGNWALYRTNGTEEGSGPIVEDLGILHQDAPKQITAMEDALYLEMHAGDGGSRWWYSEGTPESTREAAPPAPMPPEAGDVEEGVKLGDLRVFAFNDGVHGRELWVRREGDESSSLLADIYPGLPSSQPEELTLFGDVVYFRAESHEKGVELFVTDGTAQGTHMARDLFPGVRGSQPSDLIPWRDWLFFTALLRPTPEARIDRALMCTNGLAFIHVRVPHGIRVDILGRDFTVAGAHLYFSAETVGHGRQLFVTDLTADMPEPVTRPILAFIRTPRTSIPTPPAD